MQKVFSFLVISALPYCAFAQQGAFTMEPAHPAVGQKVRLTAASGTDIKEVVSIGLDGQDHTIELNGKPGAYETTYTDSTAGYLTVYSLPKQPETKLQQFAFSGKGAHAALAGYILRNKVNMQVTNIDSLILGDMEAEIRTYPKTKRANLTNYLFALSAYKKQKAAAEVLRELDALSRQKDLTGEEILLLYNMYDLYDQSTKADQYKELLKRKLSRRQG